MNKHIGNNRCARVEEHYNPPTYLATHTMIVIDLYSLPTPAGWLAFHSLAYLR